MSGKPLEYPSGWGPAWVVPGVLVGLAEQSIQGSVEVSPLTEPQARSTLPGAVRQEAVQTAVEHRPWALPAV